MTQCLLETAAPAANAAEVGVSAQDNAFRVANGPMNPVFPRVGQ